MNPVTGSGSRKATVLPVATIEMRKVQAELPEADCRECWLVGQGFTLDVCTVELAHSGTGKSASPFRSNEDSVVSK